MTHVWFLQPFTLGVYPMIRSYGDSVLPPFGHWLCANSAMEAHVPIVLSFVAPELVGTVLATDCSFRLSIGLWMVGCRDILVDLEELHSPLANFEVNQVSPV